MRSVCSILFLLLIPAVFRAGAVPPDDTLAIVPEPVSIKFGKGSFTLAPSTPVLTQAGDEEVNRIARFFADQVSLSGGPTLVVREKTAADKGIPAIIFTRQAGRSSAPEEGYSLTITPKQALLNARTGAGLFRGMQTLLQFLPAGMAGHIPPSTYSKLKLPAISITDYPRYPYRGMHLDVSRHFFSKEFVKRYIDLIAMYRMNTFHWHLTDDNGWRIEIKKYPELTAIAAWRVDREDRPWNDRPGQMPGEKATYGGYYTQDDIREIVKYAADRYITVIPEIEMPAHSVEVLAAFPGLSCTGGPFTVPPGSYWPNSDILCAGNDSVFTFMEDVLTEVMELFPSRYIHVGGDEADKSNWKKCPKCQARIKAEGLKDENELQSWFIRRVEKFILSKGRRLIGWDEILEGGLAPGATVMSWRGIDGGIAAARQGHDAIMTPVSHCYFDYYQADPEFEPKAIGGLTTLKQVYSFEPTPAELSPAEALHILGVQGNLWTEYIPDPSHAEYMALPRMIALSEVAWTPPGKKDWNGFRQRMNNQFKRLDRMGVNYGKGSFRASVRTAYDKKKQEVRMILESEQPGVPIMYTIEGNEVTSASNLYNGPFVIKQNGLIRAGLFVDGQLKEKTIEVPFLYHHAIGKPVMFITKYSPRYPGSGNGTLNDGLKGSVNHRDGMWLGYHGTDMELIIDLGKEMPVNSVQANFLQNQRSWIFLPEVVEYSLSPDGKKYHSVNDVNNKISPKLEQAVIQPFNQLFMVNTTARFIRVKAKSPRVCPAWHPGAGEPCWIFADEIVVF